MFSNEKSAHLSSDIRGLNEMNADLNAKSYAFINEVPLFDFNFKKKILKLHKAMA